mmetsp:Transcript_24047/g.43591  ORF Transcript_24047/g.43591 Transcript_24047/m.43591 type:complete len:200 (-) Transcript_24047:495-1094(-)
MVDSKLVFVKRLFDKQTALILVHGLNLVDKGIVVTLGTNTFFIQNCNQTHATFNQIQHIDIVIICNFSKLNTFVLVFCLYRSENILRKLLLQLFIGIVDTQLLKPICLKGFKPKDIEQGNNTKVIILVTIVVLFRTSGIINGSYQPEKRLGVNLLGKGIAGILGLYCIQRDFVFFIASTDGSKCQTIFDIFLCDTHERR